MSSVSSPCQQKSHNLGFSLVAEACKLQFYKAVADDYSGAHLGLGTTTNIHNTTPSSIVVSIQKFGHNNVIFGNVLCGSTDKRAFKFALQVHISSFKRKNKIVGNVSNNIKEFDSEQIREPSRSYKPLHELQIKASLKKWFGCIWTGWIAYVPCAFSNSRSS